MTLPRRPATLPGSCWMEPIAPAANCEPAEAACAAIFDTQPATVAMTPPSQSANICGSCDIAVPRFARKPPIAPTASPTKS